LFTDGVNGANLNGVKNNPISTQIQPNGQKSFSFPCDILSIAIQVGVCAKLD